MSYKNIKFSEDTIFLITGVAGFIGSNLCEALLELGYNVKGLDDFSTGKKDNLKDFIDHPHFTFVEGDIRDFKTCKEVSKDVDYILHQAAWGSVPRSIEKPLLYEEINIRGTVNIFEAARVNNVKRIIYASSSSVYGDEETLPKKEGIEGNLLSPYALTKTVNEKYAEQYLMHYGVETIGLRYFNVFGKRQDADGPYAAVIPKFINQLVNDISPTIYGDGYQSRDFTYVENAIEANLKACIADKNALGQAFNIGFGDQKTLLEVYNEISSILNKNIDPSYAQARQGDIKHSHADISKAKQFLNYQPEWSFEEGVKRTLLNTIKN